MNIVFENEVLHLYIAGKSLSEKRYVSIRYKMNKNPKYSLIIEFGFGGESAKVKLAR